MSIKLLSHCMIVFFYTKKLNLFGVITHNKTIDVVTQIAKYTFYNINSTKVRY